MTDHSEPTGTDVPIQVEPNRKAILKKAAITLLLLLLGKALNVIPNEVILVLAGGVGWFIVTQERWVKPKWLQTVGYGVCAALLITLISIDFVRWRVASGPKLASTSSPARETQYNFGDHATNIQDANVTIYQSDPNQHRVRDMRVDPNTHQTKLLTRTRAKVDAQKDDIIKQVINWELKRASSGLEYSGTRQDIFWKAFDRCLEDAARKVLDDVGKECESRAAIKEAGWLLESMVREVYRKMTDVDQRMRGKGYPKSVPRVNKQFEMECMIEKVREHVKAATALYSR